MQRYFLLKENGFELSNEDIFHIKKVMRFKVGDYFEIKNEDGIYLCKVESLEPFKYIISKKLVENNELNGYVRLLICMPKKDKLDLIIQKSVELGVNEIVLVDSSRVVNKIKDESLTNKMVRFNRIAKEASEQSKRSELTKLSDYIKFEEIANYKADYSFIAYENEHTKDEIELLKYKNELKNKTINVLIGPEGGFSNEEVSYAKENGYILTSLGKRILRSETACFAILSLLSFYLN